MISNVVIPDNPFNIWAQFASHLDAVADFCYNKTREKWLGRLAVQDVFGFGHAKAMVSLLRLDYDILDITQGNSIAQSCSPLLTLVAIFGGLG